MKRMMSVGVICMAVGSLYGMEKEVIKKEYTFIQNGGFVHDSVEWVTVSPDSRVTLSGSHFDRSILVQKDHSSMKYKFESDPCSAVFSADSKQAAIAVSNTKTEDFNDQDGFLVLSLENDKPESSLSYTRYAQDMMCRFLAFTPDNQSVIAADYRQVRFIDSKTGELKNKTEYSASGSQGEDVIAECFIREKILYALLCSGIAKRTNIDTGASLEDVTYPGIGKVRMMPGIGGKDWVSAGIDRVAMANGKGNLAVYAIATGTLVSQIYAPSTEAPIIAEQIALSSNGKKLAIVDWNQKFCITDVDTKESIPLTYNADNADEGAFRSLTFSPDSGCVLTVSQQEARIINAENGTTLFTFKTNYWPAAGQFSPDGATALIACRRGDNGEVVIAKRVDAASDNKSDGDDKIELHKNDTDSDDDVDAQFSCVIS